MNTVATTQTAQPIVFGFCNLPNTSATPINLSALEVF